METSLNEKALALYVTNQLNCFFPDKSKVNSSIIENILSKVFKRIDFCFSKIDNKYFFDGTLTKFNHLHGDQYSMFLYCLSNTMFKNGIDVNYCNKVYLLNKLLHGIDAFYEVALPDIFMFIHPIGTVLGRANYSNYFLVYQRCSIGSNHNIYPSLGEYLTLHPGSAILGNCKIENICSIAAESLIIDENISEGTLYIGNPKMNYKYEKRMISEFWR